MSSTIEGTPEIRGPVKKQVSQHADEILALPSEEFTTERLSGIHLSILRQLEQTPIIEVLGQSYTEHGSYQNIYRVHQRAQSVAEDVVEHRESIAPCGHGGIENHGEHYTCAFRLCPNTYARHHLEVDR